MRPSVIERIYPEPNSGCWLWGGALSDNGYGHFGIKGKGFLVHRYVYEQEVGPIPSGLDLDHKCRNRACCNPQHLEPVTRRENVNRGMAPIFLASLNNKKTHCPQGHEYDQANTQLKLRQKRGKIITERHCRKCNNRRNHDLRCKIKNRGE